MKEITIEEKAKAYDEALKVANKYKDTHIMFPSIQEEMFPELKESEDEKTKMMLHTIANKIGQHLRDIFTEEEYQCFDAWSNAWLEKQNEQKPVPKFKIGDTMRTLQEAKDGWTDGMPVVVSIDDKDYHCTNERIAIKDQDNYEYPPINRRQESIEWSEEDEYLLDETIQYLEELIRIDKAKHCGVDVQYYQRDIDWLKSLKDRYTWKPKKEQIMALRWILNNIPYCTHKEEINGLFEQLKKLREK